MKGYFAFILLITLFLASSMKIKQQPETISVSSDDYSESMAGKEMEIGDEAAPDVEVEENKADFHGKWGKGKKNKHQGGMKMKGNFHNKKGDRIMKKEPFVSWENVEKNLNISEVQQNEIDLEENANSDRNNPIYHFKKSIPFLRSLWYNTFEMFRATGSNNTEVIYYGI